MLAAYLSPLAPAAVLLLGAFILLLAVGVLSARRWASAGVRFLLAAGIVELAILALFGTRLTLGGDASGQGLEVLSGWSFSTVETGAALTVRADEFSLPFLIVTLLLLLAATLVAPSFLLHSAEEDMREVTYWLALGAAACFLFVSANGLTMSYAVLAFDLFTAFYWLRRGKRDMVVARVFLGIGTASGLVLAAPAASSGAASSNSLLSLVLWLRFGLFPFVEANFYARRPEAGFLVYMTLSLLISMYLLIRAPVGPLPGLVHWLAIVTVLLGGFLVWVTALENRPSFMAQDGGKIDSALEAGPGQKVLSAPEPGARTALLVPLILAESLLIFLAAPVTEGIATAFAVGLTLSLAALWITPRLGSPSLAESAWLWPYLPALAATLTLVGFPLSLGWSARTAIYRSLWTSAGVVSVIFVLLAESLALSGLTRYWLIMLRGQEKDGRRSGVTILVMVPFLIPGLAPFILSTLTRRDLAGADFDQPIGVFVSLILVVIVAVALDYFRLNILSRLGLSPPEAPAETVPLRSLWLWSVSLTDKVGKGLLRVQVVLEGQHYLSWALFIALVGALIIILS